MLLEYFKISPYKENDLGKQVANDFPSLAGFAILIGFHRDTIHEWSKVHPEFSDAYKMAKDYQENYILINGTKGLINSSFSIFTAKNILNWRDKHDVEQTVNTVAISDKELELRIKQLQGDE